MRANLLVSLALLSLNSGGAAHAQPAPILWDRFLAICNKALNNAYGGRTLAVAEGWKPMRSSDDPATAEVFVLADPGIGDMQLAILTSPGSAARAAYCQITVHSASPEAPTALGRVTLNGYTATQEINGPTLRRRLEGTASFGDPVRVGILVSFGQGSNIVDLSMINMATAPANLREPP